MDSTSEIKTYGIIENPSKLNINVDTDNVLVKGVTKETDPTVPGWAKQEEKPSYTADEVGALPADTFIPSKVSELENDAGYIDGYTETDPTVPEWAKAPEKPSYSAEEVGALPVETFIPSKLSDLEQDEGYAKEEDIPSLEGYAKEEDIPVFTNKPTLDKLSETDGTLLFDGNPIEGGSGSGIRVFNSKEEYLQAKANGEVKDGEIIGYPGGEETSGAEIVSVLLDTSQLLSNDNLLNIELEIKEGV